MVYQKHNEQEASEKILDILNQGKNVALISDAGTPCISDPGRIIVNKLADKNIKTTCITGACAITTLLASVPKDDEEFSFCGFLPRTKNEQEKLFEKFKNIDVVFYESPKRLIETLKNIIEFRGSTQKVAIGRELTKKFEEILYDSVENILNYYNENTLKGEIAAVLYKSSNESNVKYDIEVKKLLKENFSAKDVALIVSTLYEANKKEIYNLAVNLKNKTEF